ncbi:hypothetical protein IFM89_006517 [Coptis chinensis]|uniref:Uncharacterized protein n=1 Tax=Coptis chinensis TaxID=261450 RepID=A0A835M4X7_9MAGN|nr:hypothetical protein IFM89_006517 [Coptis chinensis]
MIEIGPNYTFEGSDEHLFLVKNYHGDRWVVNIVDHTYECRVWQMTEIVYVHAVRVFLPRRVEWVECCSTYFWVSEYKVAYISNVKPMKDVKDWPKHDPTKHVKPPFLVRGIGRPRKERMRDEYENENGYMLKKRKMTGNKYKGEGNNARSCKGLATSEIASNGSSQPKAKYKALRSGSDGPASDIANDASPSEPIAEPPSNSPVRVAPPRHEHQRKTQSSGPTFFKALEHRHTMGDLIRKQGEEKKNIASVLHAATQAMKAQGTSKAQATTSRSRVTTVEKPPMKPVEKPSFKPVQPRPRFKVVRVADP